MGNVLKFSRYRLVDNRAFEMPLPLKFTVCMEDAQICSYLVDEDEQVSYDIITKYKELMLTTIQRPLNISDIYYLFSCRVFQDRTPFTYPILDRMGLDKYNVYNILTRTHGISPYDEYWIRFDGEKIDYDAARSQFEEYMIEPEAQPLPMPGTPAPAVRPAENPAPAKAEEKPDVSSILNQNKVDVDSITAGSRIPVSIAPEESYAPAMELENNKMSEDEIEKLLHSVGIDSDDDGDKQESKAPDIAVGGGEALPVDGSSRSEEYAEPSGGKMSQEDIEKLLAANAPAEPAPEPAPTPTEPSGGKMSQEDIEKLLAANAPAEPAPEPAPAPTEPSGGKMSQEDIEKLLAANAPAEPEPASAPTEPSGGKMSQEDIEKLLAANAPAEPAPEPAPAPAKPAPAKSTRKSRDTKKALLERLAPGSSSESTDGKMSHADIEKAFMDRLAPASAPAEPEKQEASGGKMSQEDIEKLLAANAPAEPAPEPEKTEPVPVPETAPSGGKMSQDDIEALLNSMKEEANK